VNEKHLITGMKDLGGGGLSCVVGEMALAAGCGADVDVERVPLKEQGLAPWEIWVSESQERMMVTCKPENVDKVLGTFAFWDVLATPVAKTIPDPRMRLFWNGEKIFDMDLEFLTGGPVYVRPYTLPEFPDGSKEKFPDLPGDKEVILAMLSDPNVASKEWAIRQYDHEVRASTVIHPMVGKMNETGPGDASVLMPVPGRWKGLAAAIGCNPWFTALDPYNGGMSCIDEACRNIVAVGARPNAFTDCLNFGNPERPERLGEFREAVRGLGDMAKGLGIPIPSGNVSLYNETAGGAILPTPMILACGLIDDVRRSVTADMKKEGSCLFLIGDTKREMGGSLLFRKFGGSDGKVPGVDIPKAKKLMDDLLRAMDSGLVLSCHDCSDGGLAVAVAEMCISGGIGAELDLTAMDGADIRVKLYSESNTRWVAEIDGKNAEEFADIMGGGAVCIGITKGVSLKIKGIRTDIPVSELRKAWNDPIWNVMGGSGDE
jgi:phosphoribosylformylglycinamidine synthase